MMLIPTELLPVIGFFFVVIVGRIGTIIAGLFRKEDVSVDISSTTAHSSDAVKAKLAKHS